MKKILKILLIIAFVFLVLSIILFGYSYSKISAEVSEEIRNGVIETVTASESPVYYDDGKTVLGVFFDSNHQKYVHYEDLPDLFIKALIATEDQRFLYHHGFDVVSIIRAAISNFKAGKIVQGGSTITQQTAKNLFRRHKRTYSAKFRELLQAVCLERRFTKEELLELYSNQFHVTGAGRGVGIAAKYFFDKDAKDLELVESAFIVGAIKGPSLFNPFTKKTEEAKMAALIKAKNRKDYVLSKMYEMEFITREQYEGAERSEVPFQGGKITYDLNVILDYIQKQLQTDYFKSVFHEESIDNIATSGIKIHTSINKEIQEGALESLRRHLPLLDIKLTGYDRVNITEKYEQVVENGLEAQKQGIPILGRITSVSRDGDKPLITVAWDKGEGIIDFEKTIPFYDAWVKSKTGNWASFKKEYLPALLDIFQKNDPVAIQITEPSDEHGQLCLSLTKIPEIQGAIVVLNDGMVKAMVGGYSNQFLNRAVDSKRQLGSIFKPIVYTAALQLKWSNLEPLMNVKNLFRFENTHYVPRPDHDPVSDRVSMVWAGAKSENLASVWLLYHLIDRLNPGEFRRIVSSVGLDMKEGESFRAYMERIRDDWGITITDGALIATAFEETKKEIEADLIFNGQDLLLDTLRGFNYGVDEKLLNNGSEETAAISHISFQRLQSLNNNMKARLKTIKELYQEHDIIGSGEGETLASLLHGFSFEEDGLSGIKVIYREGNGENSVDPTSEKFFLDLNRLFSGDIWIDNLFPSAILDHIQEDMEKRFRDLKSGLVYSPDTLFRIRDFRVLTGLLYVTMLSGNMGISTRLDPVLSFPLGANAISIIEAALAYQTIMTGHSFPFSDENSTGMAPIITKITDRYDDTIWEYVPMKKKVLSDRISTLASEILRLAVEEGTGQSAKNAIRGYLVIDNETLEFPVTVYGKTGTSNEHTNSSFVGFIPGPNAENGKLERKEGYVIAAYVGYDDNRPMKGRHVTIYGSSGALPIWVDTAKILVDSKDYKEDLQLADIIFHDHSIREEAMDGLVPVVISRRNGLPIRESGSEDIGGNNPWVLSDKAR